MIGTVTKVRPGLYLGGADIAADRAALEVLGITHVLNCAGTDCGDYGAGRFEYLELQLRDKASEQIDAFFYPCYHFLTTALCSGGNVLVHCLRGVSRSATILLSYLILHEHCPYLSAVAALKVLRPCISPNLGYQRRLQAWSNRVLSPSVVPFVRVYEAGYIGSVACMRLFEAEKENFGLDARVTTVIHKENRVWIWVGDANNRPFLSAAEELVGNLQRFEGVTSGPIWVEKGKEPELFWQDFRPFYANFPSSPYLSSPQNDRFLAPITPARSLPAPCFYIYPDLVPYSHIDDRDITADGLILHYRPDLSQLWVYIGPSFEPDILSDDDYVSMVQRRSESPSVVSVSSQELLNS